MICFTLLLMCGGVLCIVAPLDFRENNESDVLCAALDDDRLPYSVGEWRQRNEPPAQWRDCRLLDADRVLSRSRFCDKYGKSAPHNLEWVPAQCRLLKFNAERWWSALRGRDLIFFGDSIVNQQYLNLGCSLEAYGANATLTLTTAPGVEGGAVHNVWAPLLFTCNDCDTPVTQKRPLSRPARIHFERTEDVLQRLLLSIDERRRRRSILLFSISAWYSERKLTDLALLLNVTRKQRAAAAERMFEDATRRFFNMTVGSFPGSVLARSAAPSHPNCRRVLKDPSVVAPQRPVTAMGCMWFCLDCHLYDVFRE